MTSTIITTLKHLQIPLEQVVKATNNFDEEYVIGGGDFGKVYRGQLLLSGEMVNIAARRLDPKHRGGGVEFWTEITVLSSLKHENILSLIGFCDENGEKIIINKDEATKGSLSMYLSDPTTLTWIQRLKICVGVARALRYIHNGEGEGGGDSVIHRNINSSTVLLDDKWEAKLSGFEYSVRHSVNRMDRVVLSEAIGTRGYMDPDVKKTRNVTYKSDIYSFGVVLCEILCGRKAFIPDVDDRFLAPLVRFHFENKSLNEIILPDLLNQAAHQSLISFSEAVYSCLMEDRVRRPNMSDIVIELEKALKLENLRKNLEHLKIPLDDIMLATYNFSKVFHVRDGEYYRLYSTELDHFDTETPSIKEEKEKGELPRRDNTVLIKRFMPTEDKKGEELFYTEIEVLNTCKHLSIVKLYGFCVEGSELILVIEYPYNGFLENLLFNKNPILTWEKRLRICLDVAYALNYLHTEMEDQMIVIHRDIRSAIIGLDKNLGAKIVDFALSIYLPLNQDDDGFYLQTSVIGTPYYRDPVYWVTGELKKKSDVYSFGVVLFEVLCGKLARDPIFTKESDKLGLPFVARRCNREGTLLEMIDPMLMRDSGENTFLLKRGLSKYSLLTFIEIALECIVETQDQRPTMKEVIEKLQEALFHQVHNQHSDMVQEYVDVVEKPIHLELAHQNYEEPIQFLDVVVHKFSKLVEWLQYIFLWFLNFLHIWVSSLKLVQVVDEVRKPGENYRKKLEHLKIPLSEINLATDNFSEANHIVDIRYYSLYRAELEKFDTKNPLIKEEKNKAELSGRRGTLVIKRILPREDDIIEEDGNRGFDTEIKMLATCKHPNIIKLFGFCDEGSERILVIEHLSNGYLDDYWNWNNTHMRHNLTWVKRLRICLDAGNALNYTHFEMEDQKVIILRDFKSLRIMLDENWGAKIIDFGRSVFLPPNQDDDALYHNLISGNLYYIDPEYQKTGKLKRESDVYTFGVVLFEVLCGRVAHDPIYRKESDKLGLTFVVRRCFQEGTLMELMDPILKDERGENNFSLKRGPNKDSLEKFIKIAYKCIAETQNQRPTMKTVINELQEALFLQENNKDEPIISLEDIKTATENFHDKNCIGKGGFGKVFKGEVPQGDGRFNTIVAKLLDSRLGQGEHQFRNELRILYEFKHENIIRLVGYCDKKDAKIIVYEYESRGSLDGYLKDARLTWMKRLNICIDVATALAFLHGGAGKQEIVIHRDIKTPNILLNDEWDAKLADFGLSLISPINQKTDYVIDHACGTRGYLDPLYLKSGFLTKESDIYSFGVVLFEIMCGKSTFEIHKHKGQYLPGFIKESFEKGKHDDLVFEALKEWIVPKALTAFQKIAYQCLHDDREKRPTANEVLEQLKEALEFQISGSD